MQPTNISWATYSHNPITGCSRIGPECYNPETGEMVCYAEELSRRQGWTDKPWTVANAAENVTMHPDRLGDPYEYSWPEGPGRVFVGSMTDMFHEEVDPAFVQESLDVARDFPEHVWIYLTKRPQNAADWDLDWPENVWLGTSVGSGPGGKYPDTTHRIDQLREVDAALRWVSFEPLIERIGPVDLEAIDWMVVGGESGEDHRLMKSEWATDLYRQAREQDVAFWFKQHAGRHPQENERLTVEDDGLYVQQRIQELPELPAVTQRARKGLELPKQEVA